MRSNLALLARRRHFKGSCTGRGPRPRPGPQGGTGARPPPHEVTHPLQPLAGASGARFAGYLWGGLFSWLGTDPGITHPVYPPGTHPGSAPTPPVHCRYVGRSGVPGMPDSCFWEPVGEPRGVEYSPFSGSLAGYIQLFEVH